MRFAALVLLLFLLVPAVQAHEQPGFGHLTVDVADLAAKETKMYHLDPSNDAGELTLSQGWVFGVYGGVQDNTSDNSTDRVDLFLYHEGIAVANWTWLAGYHTNTTRLHFTGEYEIRAYNPGDRPVRYAMYYDQSCNCKGKLIPLPGGWNMFNYDLPAGRHVDLGFPLAKTAHVRGSLALLRSQTDARWPQDFEILQQDEATGPSWLNFTFDTSAAQRYYVFVQAIDGAQIDSPLYLTPLLEVQTDNGSPAVGPALMLAATIVVVAMLRRRRFAD